MQLQRCMRRSPRTNRAQQAQWVQRYLSSGLSRKAFAQEHGVKVSTLDRWLARVGDCVSPSPKPVVFKEVVPLATAAPSDSPTWSLEILTPSGLVLRLR
jgi:transposase-like protein